MPPDVTARDLPQNPSLGLLGNLAKQLRKQHRDSDPDARERVRAAHPASASLGAEAGEGITLRDAQLVVAREYGFDNWTALKRHVQSVQQNGAADVALQDLLEAANNGRTDRISSILDAHPDIIDRRGSDGTRTALHFAAWRGHADALAELLSRGADPNVRCEGDNATPLHFAAEKGDLRAVELLVSHGADATGEGDVHAMNVIGWACVFHEDVHQHVVDYLLAHGAAHTIFSAVSCGNIAAIRSLAESDPDCLDRTMERWEDGRRPLHQAVLKRQPDAVTALRDCGAHPTLEDVNGLTPLALATILGETTIADLLLERGAKVDVAAAFGLNRSADIHRLMADDPDCLKAGRRWGRLIFQAARRGSADLVERLLDHGADVNVRDCLEGDIDAVTPLHIAAYRQTPDMDVIRLLVDRGADLAAKDDRFQSSPSGWAHHRGNTDVFEFLRNLEEQR